MIFSTAFERLNISNQEKIKVAVEKTATSVSPGGAVFGVLEEVLKSLKRIEKMGASGSSSILSAMLGKKTLVGIGESFKLIAEAVEMISGTGKEAKEKVEAMVSGVDAVISLGKNILAFSSTLALATPLLIMSIPFAPLFAGSLRIIIGALSWASKSATDPNFSKTLTILDQIGKSILILGGALVLAAPLYVIGILVAPMVALVISTLGLAFWALDKLGVSRSMNDTASSLIRASFSIVTIGLSLATTYLILSAIGGGSNFYKTTLQIIGVVVLVGAAFALVGIVSGLIKKASIALLLASAAIVTISLGIFIFSQIIPPTKEGWITLGQVGAALLGIGAVMALAGTFALPIALGAIVLGLAGLSLLVIAMGIGAISSVFKGDGLDSLLAPSGQKTRGFLGIGGGRDMSKLEYLLLSLANSFMINPIKIAAIYVTAPAMILASASLYAIAVGLKKVQDLNINPDLMIPKIESVVMLLANAFGRVGKMFPGGRKGIFNRIFGGGKQSAVADGIDAVMGMGKALNDIAKGIKMMANLKFPIYKGTEIVGYTDLRDPNIFNNVTKNISYLVSSLSGVFGEIGASPDAKKSWWFGRSNITRGIKIVKKLGKPIDKLANIVMNFSEMEVDTLQVATKLRDMISAVTNPFKELVGDSDETMHALIINRVEDLGDSLNKMARNIYTWNRFVDGFGKYAKHFGTFKSHVNDLDEDNLKMVTSLFSSLSTFDSGSINELGIKLAGVIEVMKKELKSSIDDGSAKVTKGIEDNSNGGILSDLKTTLESFMTNIPQFSGVPGAGGLGALTTAITSALASSNKDSAEKLVNTAGLNNLDTTLDELVEVLNRLDTTLKNM